MDRLIVLDGGRIVETGTHAELLRHGGTYARLWHRQSAGFDANAGAGAGSKASASGASSDGAAGFRPGAFLTRMTPACSKPPLSGRATCQERT